MEYKAIETSFWRDPKVKKMSTSEKLLFLYCMTNPHSQLSGLYWLPLEYARIETGMTESEFKTAMGNLQKKWKVIKYDDENAFIWVVNMFRYHPSANSKSTKIGIARYIKKNANETPLARKFYEYYKNFEIPLETADFEGGPGGALGGPQGGPEGGSLKRKEKEKKKKSTKKKNTAPKKGAAPARKPPKKKPEKNRPKATDRKFEKAYEIAMDLEKKIEAAFKKAKKRRRKSTEEELQESAMAIRDIHTEDGITFKEIQKIVEWMHTDKKAAKFWPTTVMSGQGLRKNMNQIVGQMVRNEKKNGDDASTTEGEPCDSGRYKD